MVSPTSFSPSAIDANWHSLTTGWVEKSSISINEVFEIAQKAFNNTKESGILLFSQLKDRIRETPLAPIINKTHSICNDIEKIFNIAGSTPWVGFLSGTIRTVFGYSQIISGIALTAISELGLMIANISKTDIALIPKWQILSKLGIEFTIHGCLNIIRGTGEAMIGTYTFGLGNILLTLPNLSSERNFAPYFPYGSITSHLKQLDAELPQIDAESKQDELMEDHLVIQESFANCLENTTD